MWIRGSDGDGDGGKKRAMRRKEATPEIPRTKWRILNFFVNNNNNNQKPKKKKNNKGGDDQNKME